MKAFHSIAAAMLCALAMSFSALASAHDRFDNGRSDNIVLAFSGLVAPNTRPQPTFPAFKRWCPAVSDCSPTTTVPVFDLVTGRRAGQVYVWGTLPFAFGAIIPSALCFSEFMIFELDDGDIHVHSGPNGTCGAVMDPVLKPPIHVNKGATQVVAGGGDGVVVGGTRKYRNRGGSFTDRVFVGFGAPTSGVGGIIYYDQLLFSISLDDR